MPFPMKIQPIDSYPPEGSLRTDPVKPVAKSRFKRLFERQFPSVLRISSAEKGGESQYNNSKDGNNGGGDLEPSSVCLAKMVQSFIEESNNDKQSVAPKCGRRRCNCFNGNCNDSSDDELEFCCGGFSDSITSSASLSSDACDVLKSLVACPSVVERNLLADTSKIVEINKTCKNKDDYRKIVTDSLVTLGYDAAICKSRWEKSPSFPAGEYEYIDVIRDDERLLVDIDFRSEFEIARSTGSYKSVLQSLPSIFIGKTDRLQQIVSIVSEAAKQSMKKKGMHFPPWRKAEYMKAKWLSPYTRTTTITPKSEATETEIKTEVLHDHKSKSSSSVSSTEDFSSEFELIFGEKEFTSSNSVAETGTSVSVSVVSAGSSCLGGEKFTVVVSSSAAAASTSPWMPPAIKPRNSLKGSKMVAGLASVLKEKP